MSCWQALRLRLVFTSAYNLPTVTFCSTWSCHSLRAFRGSSESRWPVCELNEMPQWHKKPVGEAFVRWYKTNRMISSFVSLSAHISGPSLSSWHAPSFDIRADASLLCWKNRLYTSNFLSCRSPLIITLGTGMSPSTLHTICLPRHFLNLFFFISHYSLIRIEHVRLRNMDLPPDGVSLRSGFEEWMCKQYTWKFSSWFYQFLIDIPGVWQNARRLQRGFSEALLSTSIAELAATKGQLGQFRSC